MKQYTKCVDYARNHGDHKSVAVYDDACKELLALLDNDGTYDVDYTFQTYDRCNVCGSIVKHKQGEAERIDSTRVCRCTKCSSSLRRVRNFKCYLNTERSIGLRRVDSFIDAYGHLARYTVRPKRHAVLEAANKLAELLRKLNSGMLEVDRAKRDAERIDREAEYKYAQQQAAQERVRTITQPVVKEERVMETKKCKQCGRLLEMEAFRKYTPRGNGVYNTVQGRHTVCKECEGFNAKINKLYKASSITDEQQRLLDKAAKFYIELHNRGLEPKGAYAAFIVGKEMSTRKPSATASAYSFMDAVLAPESPESPVNNLVDEYSDLLSMELVDEPDVYQDMLDSLRQRSAGADGRVLPEYRDMYTKVASRFDEYEDNYDWE